MFHQTVARRVEILARDVTCHLQNASGFSLAVDELADISDTEQLIVYVRFYVKDDLKKIC